MECVLGQVGRQVSDAIEVVRATQCLTLLARTMDITERTIAGISSTLTLA